MNKYLKATIQVILFLVFMTMVIKGQRHIGYAGISVMTLGLAGLIAQLWNYNRAYR